MPLHSPAHILTPLIPYPNPLLTRTTTLTNLNFTQPGGRFSLALARARCHGSPRRPRPLGTRARPPATAAGPSRTVPLVRTPGASGATLPRTHRHQPTLRYPLMTHPLMTHSSSQLLITLLSRHLALPHHPTSLPQAAPVLPLAPPPPPPLRVCRCCSCRWSHLWTVRLS